MRSEALIEAEPDEGELAEALLSACGAAAPASAEARAAVLAHLKRHMAEERRVIRDRLDAENRGLASAGRLSALQDEVVRALFRHVTENVFPAPSAAERLAVAAVGGYGRATLAPFSDLDLLFLFPSKETAWSKAVTEYILYMLWDLRLKVGHSTRTIGESIRAAREDLTVRTALLESRHLAGDEALLEEFQARFNGEVVAGTARDFIAAKLAERDERHARVGRSRYLVEPNVKDGKGGLRDLQTLYWIARYSYRRAPAEAMVKAGLLSADEHRLFCACEDFLWAVRCHLHFLSGRAEERVSFDVQGELADRLGYRKHPGLEAVERFMKHYFLVAKDVGDLTRIVCAALEERHAKPAPRLNRFLADWVGGRRRTAPSGFVEERGRINVADGGVFARDPVNLIRIFHRASEADLALHPDALRLVTRSLKLIDGALRANGEANRLFLEILTSTDSAEVVLRLMNETGVLGRFIPPFGKVVAMMQFSMYHHYTVDEHLLRSVGILGELDAGRLKDDHPLSAEILSELKDKTVLYVALFLHDIAKGRPEDHSLAGAEVARSLCPRLGLSAQQTENVAWLVEHHLLMSITAQSRDLADRRTILDFAGKVQTTERLKLLLVLTVCDIRAVGPGVWTGWKGQLLRTLYYETEPHLSGGYSRLPRGERLAEARAGLSAKLAGWTEAERERVLDLHYPAYWFRVDEAAQLRHAELVRDADARGATFASTVRPMTFEGATEIVILAPDHPRLLSLMAGACAATGANIVDAQIHTTTDGRALDTIHVSRAFDRDEDELRRGRRIAGLIEDALSGRVLLPEAMASRQRARTASDAFSLEPDVSVSNALSDRFTVVEVSCLDRVGLLYDLSRAMSDLSLDIGSARIATFGERAVDTFYVTDLFGQQIASGARQARIRGALLEALCAAEEKPAAASAS